VEFIYIGEIEGFYEFHDCQAPSVLQPNFLLHFFILHNVDGIADVPPSFSASGTADIDLEGDLPHLNTTPLPSHRLADSWHRLIFRPKLHSIIFLALLRLGENEAFPSCLQYLSLD
jgi:hypothetical protein